MPFALPPVCASSHTSCAHQVIARVRTDPAPAGVVRASRGASNRASSRVRIEALYLDHALQFFISLLQCVLT